MKFSVKIIVSMLMASLLLAQPAMAAGKLQCLSEKEANALNIRVLQTDLMVSGLACKLQKEYAGFVTKQKQGLARHSAVMQSYFKRITGSTTAMDKFVTGLANAASTQSLQMKEGSFCSQAKQLFAEVTALEDAKLVEKLANTPDIVIRRGVPLCTQTAKK